MTGLIEYLAFAGFAVLPVALHLRNTRRREAAAVAAATRNGKESNGPRAQHPHIDVSHCIGCGSCIDVCPEGDVLGLIAGKAAIVNGAKCIGHGLCADACPVGAIEIVMASPSISADLPRLTGELETSVPNLFIVGELGGLALIKNAVNQGRDCIDTIARRLAARRVQDAETYDVCIVGAGPGGLSASLRAIEKGLRYLTLEQGELGGTVAQYPRQKLVLTSPVQFPMHGRFGKLELSKEKLVKFWADVARRAGLKVHTGEKVEAITSDPHGGFAVQTNRGCYRAVHVVLALGRRGSPRKLGIAGEERSKVMYSLIDAEAYRDARILVVGGGDSAVEAALGLAAQRGNHVTLSYRQPAFSRIKERNSQRIQAAIKGKKVEVLFSSRPIEIRAHSVCLETNGSVREIPNDWVWVFAGGDSPNAFLAKIGVAMGSRDLTDEAAQVAQAEGLAAGHAGPKIIYPGA